MQQLLIHLQTCTLLHVIIEKLTKIRDFFFVLTENISPSEQEEASKFGFKLQQTFGINGGVTIAGEGKQFAVHMEEV